MRITLLLLSGVISNGFSSLQTLRKEDLYGRNTELVYIHYSRPGIACSACESFNQSISTLQQYIPIKKINFFEDPRLASRFYTFLFPSFVIRDEGRSYHLPVDTFDQLEEIVKNEKWRGYEPVKWYMEVDSYLTGMYSLGNFMFFRFMQKSYVVLDVIPSWIVSFIFSTIVVYMIYSIFSVLRTPVEREKKD